MRAEVLAFMMSGVECAALMCAMRVYSWNKLAAWCVGILCMLLNYLDGRYFWGEHTLLVFW